MTFRCFSVAVIVLAWLGTACGPPVRISHVSSAAAYRAITANALGTDHASVWTRTTVNEWGLLERFDDRPDDTLAELHRIVTSGRGGPHELFALAELSFLHGDDTGERPYHLAAVVYAYAFLFPREPGDLLEPLDPRTRLATDLYNRALTKAFPSRDGRTVEFTAGTYPLPFGELELAIDPAQLDWGDRRLVDLRPVAEIEVHGLRNRHRMPGLGAALVAGSVPRENVDVQKSLISPRAQVAATAVLRLAHVHEGLVAGRLRGVLDLYAASDAETVTVDGRKLPLEIDETTAIAVQLAGSPIWKQELWGFLGRDTPGFELPRLLSLEPYRQGRIPVVFVHGTQSSPARWADMANDLLADPWIRQRYQFWYFFYDSGNPVPYSGLLLRESLSAAVKQMDPEDRDPCLHEMVVVGHSQGGLLAKLTAVDTGDVLWNAVMRVPPAEAPGSPEFRALLEKALIVKPLPFVRRLVFIATPHRGSFRTGEWVNGLLRRLIRLPMDVVSLSATAITQGTDAFRWGQSLRQLPTAVDNMTPGNPFLEGLARIPVAAGVPYDSIVAVKTEFPVVETGNDGVVAYTSAHLDGAASELIVRSPHSCQANPLTIQEVRRILHIHGDALAGAGLSCGPAAADQAK